MAKTSGAKFLSLHVPGRNNVREPLRLPTMRLVRPSGTVMEVELNEADLLAMLRSTADVLARLYDRRDATVPEPTHG